jgi:recombinational DNA repair ATPase RecF
LKNRNKLLKNIFENKAKKDELHFWDIAFADATDKYYRYRKKFIFFIEENIKIIEGLLDNKYKLKFSYETKIDMEDVKNSVSSYLQKNIDRDIML